MGYFTGREPKEDYANCMVKYGWDSELDYLGALLFIRFTEFSSSMGSSMYVLDQKKCMGEKFAYFGYYLRLEYFTGLGYLVQLYFGGWNSRLVTFRLRNCWVTMLRVEGY